MATVTDCADNVRLPSPINAVSRKNKIFFIRINFVNNNIIDVLLSFVRNDKLNCKTTIIIHLNWIVNNLLTKKAARNSDGLGLSVL